MLFAKALVNFFMNTPSDMALQSGMTFLHIVTPFYLIVSVKLVADGILRGSGLMKYFMISTFTDLILRVVLAEVLSIPFQSTGIWCAWPIGWTIAMVMSVMFYRKAYKDA
jgi:Na+-driven multidrug efflux pump